MTDEKDRLTIEKLKKHSGFENVTDEEAEVSIDIIERLSNILFLLWMEEEEKRKESKEEHLEETI